jgi:hypothetical protein
LYPSQIVGPLSLLLILSKTDFHLKKVFFSEWFFSQLGFTRALKLSSLGLKTLGMGDLTGGWTLLRPIPEGPTPNKLGIMLD